MSERWASRVRELLGEPSDGEAIAGTAYATAWLASVPSRHAETRSRFPACLHWLLDQQHPDGSWGSAIPHPRDRLVSTLAALTPLARFGTRARERVSVARGTRYLWQNSHLATPAMFSLADDARLLATLAERARAVGVPVPPNLSGPPAPRESGGKSHLLAARLALEAGRRDAAAAGAPDLLPVSPGLASPATVRLIESLGDAARLVDLRAAQGPNGALGNSPAATAFFLAQSDDPRALAYLDGCLVDGGRAAPAFHPCETFELLRAAYLLFLAGVPAHRLLDRAERTALRAMLDRGGVGLSPSFPNPTADDTAIALVLLGALGEPVSTSVLEPFARSDGSFSHDPDDPRPAVGASLHVLHALLRVPGFPNRSRAIARLVDYLVAEQVGGLYWVDSAHLSPYAATAHALRVFAALGPEHARHVASFVWTARAWLRHTQTSDGPWGFFGQPTAEETAYAVLALTTSAGAPNDPRDWRGCGAADRYLEAALAARALGQDQTFPALWVGPCLYAPTLVVRATIEAARLAFRRVEEQARTAR